MLAQASAFEIPDAGFHILDFRFQIADLQLTMEQYIFSTTPMKLFSTTISGMIG